MRNKISDRFRQTAGSLTVVLGLLLATAAVATDLNPRLVGSYKTTNQLGIVPARAVAVSGNVAYVATSGTGLQILDVSNPASPTRIGGYSPSSSANSVVISGNYAYLCEEFAGLTILSVTNPAAPRRVGGYKPVGSGSDIAVAKDVFLSGQYAYIAAGEGGLVVLDVSNPASPRWVGALDVPGEAHGVVVSGNYAYLADGFLNGQCGDPGALRIIDISNPASPQAVADYPIGPGNCNPDSWSISVNGHYAYVSGAGTFDVIDITDPANPQQVATRPGWGYPAQSGNLLVLGVGEVFDIRNPASPRKIGGLPDAYGFTSRSVALVDHYAYVASPGDWHPYTLMILDLTPANLARVGHLDTSGAALSVAVSGTQAYVTDTSPGLQVVDVSDPLNPVALGSYSSSHTAGLVAASGNYVRMFEFWSEGVNASHFSLEIVDASNPASPQRMGSYDLTSRDVYGRAVSGDDAFLASGSYDGSWHYQLETIDLRNPANPQPVGSYSLDSYLENLALHGTTLLATGTDGLQVLDVSDPANIQWVGSYTNTGSEDIQCLTTSGTRAYAVSESAGLLVLDLSDPTEPKLIGSKTDPSLGWWCTRLASAGDLVYVAARDHGVQVFDISNPTQPRYAGGSTAVRPNDLVISGNQLFVAGHADGLQVFDLELINTGTAPTLTATRSGSALLITWPAAASGFVLESATQLVPTPNWSPAPETPVLNGDQNVVTVNLGAGSRVFRLKKP